MLTTAPHIHHATSPYGTAVLDVRRGSWLMLDPDASTIWRAVTVRGGTAGLADEIAIPTGQDPRAVDGQITAFVDELTAAPGARRHRSHQAAEAVAMTVMVPTARPRPGASSCSWSRPGLAYRHDGRSAAGQLRHRPREDTAGQRLRHRRPPARPGHRCPRAALCPGTRSAHLLTHALQRLPARTPLAALILSNGTCWIRTQDGHL